MSYPLNLTDRQKYFHLLGDVCETLKASACDEAIRRGHKTPSISLNNVRGGKKHHLADLIDLIRIGLPEYVIVPELLPAPSSQQPLFPAPQA